MLAIIGPILFLITLWLHFANKGAGAFFTQERPGRNGKIFKVIKFKTMTDERDVNGDLLPDEQRLTKVGKLIRSTSVDELPHCRLGRSKKTKSCNSAPLPLESVRFSGKSLRNPMRRGQSKPDALPESSWRSIQRASPSAADSDVFR